jgi:aerobic-type carbon monoxide dehydrogenase small subunit (CoxS/CutS family)
MALIPVNLTINGKSHQATFKVGISLLYALRNLGYVDVKNGCEKGDCGACAVLLDGKAVNSCMVLACEADGSDIITNAGLGDLNKPHPLQEAFADMGAVQCGYCTSGMIISSKALLDTTPDPSQNEIREAISGNLCRCGCYDQISTAVRSVADKQPTDLESNPILRGEA